MFNGMRWNKYWHQAIGIYTGKILGCLQFHSSHMFSQLVKQTQALLSIPPTYVSTCIYTSTIPGRIFHEPYIISKLASICYPLQLWCLGCWLLHFLVCCHNMQWCMAIRTCHVHISPIPHQDLHNSRMFSFNSKAQWSQLLQMVFCIQVASGLKQR